MYESRIEKITRMERFEKKENFKLHTEANKLGINTRKQYKHIGEKIQV
jgi:hypothetical protein